VKIVAGELGGRLLATPRGRAVRPTAARLREALFQRIGPLPGAAVLDLFAGSGALGFEALSRGAASCLFADVAAASISCIRANVKALGLERRATVRRADFKRVLRDEARGGVRYDLVLLDPPYDAAAGYAAALGELLPPVLAPAALIVIESAHGLELALDLPADPPRRYGASTIQILRNGP
jgi:16S rRNA (guanine966-N2)-methyltransferase